MQQDITLIIPFAGYGKRVERFIYPKLLLPVDNTAILNRIIDYWNPKQTIIVCNKENYDIVRQYSLEKHEYVVVSSSPGSGFTVQKGLDVARHDRIVVNWSDVLPTEKIDIIDNFFLTSPDIKCSHYGKMGGMYGVFSWDRRDMTYSLREYDNTREPTILDAIHIDSFTEVVADAIDIGEEDKYLANSMKTNSTSTPVRPFNKIEFKDDVVIKHCKDSKIKECECDWYKKMSHLDCVLTPISYNPLTLPRANGGHKIYDISSLLKMAEEIHSAYEPIDANPNDCYEMYINKTLNRLRNVSCLTDFGHTVVVNGVKCVNPISLIKMIDIESMIPEKFFPIHGDITTSNVIWHDSRPYIIDPRGLFGSSKLYGDRDYDIAKIYYSLTNWHFLNRGMLIPKKHGEGFVVDNPISQINKKIDFLLAVIWLSVTDYVRSNVLSVGYSYLYGTLLINRWVEDYKLGEDLLR